ncbi:hypothetical protein CLV92_106175 [Kineococcus xinjiangensis]|uniref:Uncharacterized protein n=1 Tax=Kineococcus xinjiangensis TaxID=512762 RepID=A0A2S6IM81_9ACTN|nr:hypothetical protein [Kineococcus xinjiangensis]PPK95354.1 hypothetical protein CLV92_106175 [Kineococcus xinjiangensis]
MSVFDLQDDVYLVGSLYEPAVWEGEDPTRRYCGVRQGDEVLGFPEERFEVLHRLRLGTRVGNLLGLLGADGQRQLGEMVQARLVVVEPTSDREVLDRLLLRAVYTDLGPVEADGVIHAVRFGDGSDGHLSRHTLALIEECDEGKPLGATITEMEGRGAPPRLFATMLAQDLHRLFGEGHAFFDWTPTA